MNKYASKTNIILDIVIISMYNVKIFIKIFKK